LGLLVLAFRAGFQPSVIGEALQSLNPVWALATIALVMGGALLKAWRWSLLLSSTSPISTPSQTLGPLLTGQAFNMLTIARLGDVVRVWLLSSHLNLPLPAVAATLVVENVFELCAYGSLALMLSGTLAAVTASTARLPITIAAALVGLLALIGLTFFGDKLLPPFLNWLDRRQLLRLRGWLSAASSALEPLKQARQFWPIVGLTAMIWLLAWFTNLTLFQAFGLDLPPAAGLLILVLIIIGVAPGLMPTNIGPFYFLTIFALQQYKVDSAIALAYAAVLHLMVTGVPIVGAGLYLADQWRRTGLWPRLNPPPTWPQS
jgi:hypothetical protein